MAQNTLLSIVELGGYPDFKPLYEKAGYRVVSTDSVRKAIKLIRKHKPTVIVSEFNFQSDFRDRTSSLETVISSAQGVVDSKMFGYYEKDYKHQYDRVWQSYLVHASLAFPSDEKELERVLL